ncbi:hypothetical protein ACOZ4F_02220 [Haloarcula marismortui]|uniref:hypothetical protein n=1 Tax=Haloarcula marismortui TaxID=2238 RepID=UPI003C76D360
MYSDTPPPANPCSNGSVALSGSHQHWPPRVLDNPVCHTADLVAFAVRMAVVAEHDQIGVDLVCIADNFQVRVPVTASSGDLDVNGVASLGDFCQRRLPSYFNLLTILT